MLKKILKVTGVFVCIATMTGTVISIIENTKNAEKHSGANQHNSLYEKYIKRILDVVLSLSFILVFWWLYIIIALLVKVKLGSPVLFVQKRPGRDGELFNMVKFRTMLNSTDKNGNLLSDEERLTHFGKVLRSTSLDEIPEVFLILTGKMSVVGNRPLLPEYMDRYTEEQKRRHEVKPGLTGYAQVNGRNAISWEEKFKLDVWYVDHVSFLLDLKILLQTVGVVFNRTGISSETSVTMEEFKGTSI